MPANPELLAITEALLAPMPGGKAQLVDMLNAIKNKLGYVPPSVVGMIADKADVSRPEVYTAIELSPTLSLTPTGDHKLFICNADNCCQQGGNHLMNFAKQQLGINEFETTADDKIRLEPFQCLGNCSMAPNIMVNGRVLGMMDNDQLAKLITELQR